MSRRVPLTFWLSIAWSLLPAGVWAKPISAGLLLEGRDVPEPGFVVGVESGGIRFSASSSGASSRLYPFDRVKRVDLQEPDQWRRALELMHQEKFDEAVRLFDGIAETYRDVRALKDGYGAMAMFHAMECLRRSGNYGGLSDRVALLKEEYLSELYRPQIRMFSFWSALGSYQAGKENVDRLVRLTEDIEDQDLPGDQMAQASYVAGVVREAQGQLSEALSAYHRAFTLNMSRDRPLVRMAMEAALRAYLKDPDLEKNRVRLREAHGLGKVYQALILEGGRPPADIARFSEPMPPEPAEEETAS